MTLLSPAPSIAVIARHCPACDVEWSAAGGDGETCWNCGGPGQPGEMEPRLNSRHGCTTIYGNAGEDLIQL